MTEIKPTYLTFEQAKVLKEKGFDVPCFYYYEDGKLVEPYLENGSSTDTGFRVDLSDLLEHYSKHSKRISAPEQWQVVEWLRMKHKIWIQVIISVPSGKCFCNVINNWTKTRKGAGNFNYPDDEKQLDNNRDLYNSPQEAYSAAFDYILNNLI